METRVVNKPASEQRSVSPIRRNNGHYPEDHGPLMEAGRLGEKWFPGMAKAAKDYLGPGGVQTVRNKFHQGDQWMKGIFGGN